MSKNVVCVAISPRSPLKCVGAGQFTSEKGEYSSSNTMTKRYEDAASVLSYSASWARNVFSWIFFILALQEGNPDPLEAILVIFGRRALIFFCLKALGKNKKWRHFGAHAQWSSPWRRKNVEKGHLAPSNLTFLLIAIDTNGFRRMKEEGQIYKTLPQIF